MQDHASLGESSGIHENLIFESSLIKQDICQQSTDDWLMWTHRLVGYWLVWEKVQRSYLSPTLDNMQLG